MVPQDAARAAAGANQCPAASRERLQAGGFLHKVCWQCAVLLGGSGPRLQLSSCYAAYHGLRLPGLSSTRTGY
jgi:hypothetical protein